MVELEWSGIYYCTGQGQYKIEQWCVTAHRKLHVTVVTRLQDCKLDNLLLLISCCY